MSDSKGTSVVVRAITYLDPTSEEMTRRFTHHPPSGDQPARYQIIRDGGLAFALEVATHCPDSREKSLAITKIEEACFWANAAIARRE